MRRRTARGLVLRAVFVFATGCDVGFAPTTPDPVDYAVPSITTATVACDPERPRWTFTVDTTAWTGNGEVLLSADGAYIERHDLDSTSAAADGTSDHLELKLDVVSDWRDVSEGANTVFNCGEPVLVGVIQVFTRDGDDVADCRGFGTTPSLWADWEPETACAVVLDPETTASR